MTRRFDSCPIPSQVLGRIVATAASAPSAGKTNGVELLVLESPDRRTLFWDLASDPEWRGNPHESGGLRAAPVIIVPVTDPAAYVERYGRPDKASSTFYGLPAADWPVPYWVVDASFAAMLLLLAAADAGLGALFFHLHRPAESVLAGFDLPTSRVVIGAIALGYPASRPPAN